MSVGSDIVRKLLQIKAIKVQMDEPFIWSSGIESPIYCDNRVIWSFPGIRSSVIKALQDLIEEPQNINAIVGVATAGIAPAAYLSHNMSLPLAYVRSSKKAHGMQNKIEGYLNGNEKVVVVEDLISTGGSSIQASQALIGESIKVHKVISIFSYGLNLAQSNFDKAKLQYASVANLKDLFNVGLESGFLSKRDVNKIESWKSKLEKSYQL
jgi:orotate phosphoribosyltransferase